MKIASWLMGFVLTAKAMMGFVIITEVLFAGFFYILIVNLTEVYGIEAASISYAIVYAFHLVVMYWLLNKKGLF